MPSEMKQCVAVLVNGSEDSAGGVRARGLFEPLSDIWQAEYFYRDLSKLSSLRRFVRQIRRLQPSLIYVIDTAISGAGAAVLARIFYGKRYVIDTGDLGYELAESIGNPGWAGRKVIGLVEFLSLKLASAIVVRGTYHKEILETAGFRRIFLIRDGLHIDEVGPKDIDRDLRQQLGLEDCLCVGMMGSIKWSPKIGMCYGWDLVEAIGLLPPELPVRGLVVGDGDGLPILQKRAAALGIGDRILFVGRIPYSEVQSYLSVMDVALSTQTNNRVGQVRTTGKLPEYMVAGCYILATDVGEARLLLPPEMRLRYDGIKDPLYPARLAEKISELEVLERDKLKEYTRGTIDQGQSQLNYRYLSSQLRQALQTLR